jgi:YafQ family addiction module toxin component
MYRLEVAKDVDKRFSKLAAKDPELLRHVHKKIEEIRQFPYHFKPLKRPLQNKRRVHVGGSFVLMYDVDEALKTVRVLAFEHHDDAYVR